MVRSAIQREAAVRLAVPATLAVQTIEGNFLTPMVQSRTADLPPALLLIVQVLTGALFGLLGVALQTLFVAPR